MGRIALLTAIAALAAPAPAPAAEPVTIPAAHIVVTLEPDGVVDMLEDVELQVPESYDARREVSMQQGELFAEPSVVVDGNQFQAGDGHAPGTFLVSRGARGIRFDWRQPRGAGSVRLGYRLALLGTSYSDVVDMRLPVWEHDWPAGASVLTAAVKLPQAARGRIYAWTEPGSLAAKIVRSSREVRLRARDVPAGKRVILHIVFPRAVLDSVAGTKVKSEQGLAAILAARNDHGRTWWPWAVGAAVVLAISGAALGTARSRRLRRR